MLAGALLMTGLAACGYHPASTTDVARPAYQADLSACKDTATTQVDHQNA